MGLQIFKVCAMRVQGRKGKENPKSEDRAQSAKVDK